MLRAKPHGKNRISEFLEHYIIAIGWPQIGNLSDVGKDEIRDRLLSNEDYKIKYDTIRKVSMAVSQIQRFATEMEIGDYVIVPNADDIYFGVITSDYIYAKDRDNPDEGYPHQRKVNFKLHLKRDDLDQGLRESLRATMTLANLSEHRSIVKNLVDTALRIDHTVDPVEEPEVFELNYPLEHGGSASINIPKTANPDELKTIINIISKL